MTGLGPGTVPTSNYVSHYDPAKSHHRAWLQAVLDRLVQHEPKALAEGSELRDLWKAAVETKAPQAWPEKPATTTEVPAAVAVALPLVKEFEGCRLRAYPDPESGGEPWTIGWGSTAYGDGAPVREGDSISQELADALLAGQLERDAGLLERCIPGWRTLNANQQAALLSFTYNCGPEWFGREGFDTLTDKLKQGRLEQVPAALMLYVNPGGPSEAGLRRRRKAEGGALWAALPRQQAARPEGSGPSGAAAAKAAARALPQPPIAAGSAAMAGAGPAVVHPILVVPWFSQLDSSSDQGRRMCFSSSCAMLLAALRPQALQGANGDEQYLKRVLQFGDTTEPAAQLQALASYGVRATFSQQASFQTIERQIEAGIPVPCGYLHRGPVSRPSGSGHWLIVVGHTPTHLIVHDPYGEADLVNGTTVSTVARYCRYSRRNFGPRWMVEGEGTGWAVLAQA